MIFQEYESLWTLAAVRVLPSDPYLSCLLSWKNRILGLMIRSLGSILFIIQNGSQCQVASTNQLQILTYLLIRWSVNTSPQSELRCTRFRLVQKRSKSWPVVGFVKMSASWSLEEMNRTSSPTNATFSRTKWKSISICFVRAWNTGLAVKYVAPR
jgi:hypothetical protein